MFRLSVFGVIVAALMAVMTPAPAGAITYDKLAYLTFNGPVQVPGVVLNAGTYRFRLANSETSRNVIQVLSHDGSTVYAMFHTIPDGRMTLTAEPLVTFRETPAGVPVAVKSLFYGHEYRGYEFVYPEGGPIMTADVAPQPEIWYLPGPAVAVAEPIAEAEIAPMLEPEAELAQAPVQEPAELPRTASPLPFLAVGGLTSLFAGLGLGLLRRHIG